MARRPGFTDDDLTGLAQRLPTAVAADALDLSDGLLAQIREIATHMRLRAAGSGPPGNKASAVRAGGVIALFTGDSSAGRTRAAQVLAHELGLDLYRVDPGTVVSRYIGETEKNLSRIFEAAAGSSVVLLFDDAEALFGKRSEVKDSHDRYANVEVNFLLQRIEAFAGLAILASNRRSAIDEAFLRRCRFVVEVR